MSFLSLSKSWDNGTKVNIGGIEITDEFMGKFHRQGLAKEYNEIGIIKLHLP